MIAVLRCTATTALIALPLYGCATFGYPGPKQKCVLRHYVEYRASDVTLPGCDPESFEVLSPSYARDADQVWFTWHPIPDADAGGFEVISNRVGSWAYARDDRHVYLQQHHVCGADPATFRLLDSPYARDASKVFCSNVPIAVSDPERFEVLVSSVIRVGGPGTRGANWLTPEAETCLRDAVPQRFEAEGAAFLPTDQGWARDGQHYFRGCYPMIGIDYGSFEVLSEYYSKDRRAVYWAHSELPGADPSTFEVLRPEHCSYAKDARAVYAVGRVVPGADPATFEVAGPWRLAGPRACQPRDAQRVYFGPNRPRPPKTD